MTTDQLIELVEEMVEMRDLETVLTDPPCSDVGPFDGEWMEISDD